MNSRLTKILDEIWGPDLPWPWNLTTADTTETEELYIQVGLTAGSDDIIPLTTLTHSPIDDYIEATKKIDLTGSSITGEDLKYAYEQITGIKYEDRKPKEKPELQSTTSRQVINRPSKGISKTQANSRGNPISLWKSRLHTRG